ncbi:MAG: glycosyltransferase family 2 protein [Candidatus Komeilibacteria bacterium]|nr:glycosyltransferase family 2 protein [Candidatus Komeilibacteria bacterium]
MNNVFIIIPCYNEAEHLAKVIESVKPYGRVVVVDDGSTDNSFQIAVSSGTLVLKHLVNRGMGAALETGDRLARSQGAEIVVHFDADGQHVAEEIPLLIQPIVNNEADAVLGSRFLKPTSAIPFFKKHFILKPAVFFQNSMLGVKLTDAHNGFRALSCHALEKIRITQDGMAHATEIIEQIKTNNLTYQEVPVTVIYHEFGQGFLSGLKILKDLIFGKINK